MNVLRFYGERRFVTNALSYTLQYKFPGKKENTSSKKLNKIAYVSCGRILHNRLSLT
jgi:hypothetical protein